MNSGSYQTSRMAEVRHVLWIVLLLNLLVALAKFFYGLATNSHSMQADGIHSVFDSMGNVVGLVGITLALRPADEGHPYGHFKFETYASMVIGILLIVAAFEVGSSAISALISGDHNASVTVVSYVVMVGTLCINIGVTTYERRVGKRLNSDILLGFAIADSVMALVVMVAILYTAFDVFRSAFQTLSDKARIPEEEVRKVVENIAGVRNAHRIRTRGTQGDVYADLHVLVDPSMTVAASHELADRIESEIVHKFPQVKDILVHIEPDDAYHRAESHTE